MARWRELVVDGLGLAVGSGPEADGLYLRLDERRARLIVLPGETDKALAVAGKCEISSRSSVFVKQWRRPESRSRFFPRSTPATAMPSRSSHSAIPTATESRSSSDRYSTTARWSPPHGGRFVTGDQGLGHVVLPVTRFDEAYTFYTEVLGFLPRGSIRLGGIDAPPPARRVRFMGVNQRHHSLALCPAPPVDEPGLVHLMMEAETLDAVGQALDRVAKLGFSISSTLGRHTNDKMVSFYVRAPGGWDLEFGCEGMLVDEAFYTAEEITADSYWGGHDWSESEPLAAFTPKS